VPKNSKVKKQEEEAAEEVSYRDIKKGTKAEQK
jgi:hypothetical protein